MEGRLFTTFQIHTYLKKSNKSNGFTELKTKVAWKLFTTTIIIIIISVEGVFN